ncbi:MAG: RnfH family protein [Neisseriales bacterium]|nr:MAG: RnfH family protein [Neisseriales bacterium]
MELIEIEVAFATPELQKIIKIEITTTTKITEAIKISKINDYFPEYDLTNMPVGIFGKRQFEADIYELKAGDRIEIYRQLAKTPNQKRLERAKNK